NELNRVEEFNLSQPAKFKQRIGMVLQDVATRLSTIRFTKKLLHQAGVWREAAIATNPLSLNNLTPNSDALAKDLLAMYKGNIEIVKALSEHYHFKYLVYWQPTIFQKVHLTQYERVQAAEIEYMEQLVHRTNEVLQQSRLAQSHEYSFHDLSLVFADVREPMYVDCCHVGESGNEIIAKRMASDVLGLRTLLRVDVHRSQP